MKVNLLDKGIISPKLISPELFIITGSNGAGKSSVGPDYLPDHLRDKVYVFDGDKLFSQKQKELFLSGMKSHKEMRDLSNEFVADTFNFLVEESIKKKKPFVYEGHFTDDNSWNTPRKFKNLGYVVNMLFFGLRDPDVSQLRVTARVNEGGHNVPRFEIESNFYGNLEKLNQYFSLIDNLTIMETSELTPVVLASFINSEISYSLSYDKLPEWFIEYLPELTNKIQLKK